MGMVGWPVVAIDHTNKEGIVVAGHSKTSPDTCCPKLVPPLLFPRPLTFPPHPSLRPTLRFGLPRLLLY